VLADGSHPEFYYVLFRSKSATGPDTWPWILAYRISLRSWRMSRRGGPGTTGDPVPHEHEQRQRTYRSSFVPHRIHRQSRWTAITSLNVGSTRIDITLTQDPEALAYIIERSADSKAGRGGYRGGRGSRVLTGHDRLRHRRLLVLPRAHGPDDMSISETGNAHAHPSEFVDGPQIDNTLNVYMENVGTRVEFPMLPGVFVRVLPAAQR